MIKIKEHIGHIALVILASIIAIGFLYVVSADEININHNETTTIYISSKYGTKCYTKGDEHGNIKHPIEFKNEEECKKFISKK